MGRGCVSIANWQWYSLMSLAFSDADVFVVVGSLLNASVHGSMRVFRKSVGEENLLPVGVLFCILMKGTLKVSAPSRGGLARFRHRVNMIWRVAKLCFHMANF